MSHFYQFFAKESALQETCFISVGLHALPLNYFFLSKFFSLLFFIGTLQLNGKKFWFWFWRVKKFNFFSCTFFHSYYQSCLIKNKKKCLFVVIGESKKKNKKILMSITFRYSKLIRVLECYCNGPCEKFSNILKHSLRVVSRLLDGLFEILLVKWTGEVSVWKSGKISQANDLEIVERERRAKAIRGKKILKSHEFGFVWIDGVALWIVIINWTKFKFWMRSRRCSRNKSRGSREFGFHWKRKTSFLYDKVVIKLKVMLRMLIF